ASFSLQSRSSLQLDSGGLTRVRVHSEALYKHGFEVTTKHGSIRTYDGDYSIEAQSGRTIINVARGRVEVQRPNSSEVRIVPDGMCAELSENESTARLYPFVRVDIQPLQSDRV